MMRQTELEADLRPLHLRQYLPKYLRDLIAPAPRMPPQEPGGVRVSRLKGRCKATRPWLGSTVLWHPRPCEATKSGWRAATFRGRGFLRHYPAPNIWAKRYKYLDVLEHSRSMLAPDPSMWNSQWALRCLRCV